ncbi:MAG: creatininase family protein [Rhodothermales bacterium]
MKKTDDKATMRPYILAETNWRLVQETHYEVAIQPWGATEAHNYHLPYGTDVYECDAIAAEAARLAWDRGARVIVLPTIPYGVNTGQLDIKLDMNMRPSTQAVVLGDIVDTLARAGVPKFVVMNGHGGNDFKQMLRELQADVPDVFMCSTNWYQVIDPAPYFDEPGDHAGEMETSAIMHLQPGLVTPLSEAGSGEARKFSVRGLAEGWVSAQREWSRVTDDTGVGNPAASSAEKGERYLADVCEKLASFLVDLASCPLEDLYV